MSQCSVAIVADEESENQIKNEMFDNSLVDWPLQHVSTLHVEASSVPKSQDLLPLTDPASGNRYK